MATFCDGPRSKTGEAKTVGYGTVGTHDIARAAKFYDALFATRGAKRLMALELGAQDEETPGPHGDGFYAGYFRDLDGNKLNPFIMG